jgi:hypothetical protein
MLRVGINPLNSLENNDSYKALGAVGSLILTGPTGTNVNDLTVVLIREAVSERSDRRFVNLERVLNEGIKTTT